MTRLIRRSSLALMAALLLAGSGLSALAQGAAGGPVVIVPKKVDPNQLISFNFQQADIDDILRFLADASGKIVFKDPAVVTTLTIRNQSRIKVSEAISLLQTILSLKGFTIIEEENILIVTTIADAQTRRNTRVSIGKSLDQIPQGREVITHIFPLSTADAVRLREELQPLFPAGSGVIIANGDTNSLIVIGEADKIRRIALIINQVDRDLKDEIEVEVITLKYADATEVARYLTELFRPDETRTQQGGGQPGQPGGMTPPARSGLAQLRGRVRFAADRNSNRLIVYAAPSNIKAIKDLVAEIDVNLTARTEFRIVELKYADANALADQLNQILDPSAQPAGSRTGFVFPGFGGSSGGERRDRDRDGMSGDFRVVPDTRTNSLIILAPLEGGEALERLAKSLDRPTRVTDVVRVFQLQNAIASEVARTLQSLFQGTTQQGGLGVGLFGSGQRTQIPPNSPLDLLRQVTIVPNDQTNQLLVSGPAQAFPVIEQLIRGNREAPREPPVERENPAPGEVRPVGFGPGPGAGPVPDLGAGLDGGGLDRPLPQVFIEVIIADITLDASTRFGIEWNAVAGTSSFGTNFGLASPTADPTGFRYSVVSQNFQATLQALRNSNRVQIISTPHVMVTDNSPALISIGERIPYAGQTTVTSGIAQTSVEFQDVAITLNVTPHISPGNRILMDIDQVVNSLVEFIQVAPGQLAPRTTNRRAGTTVIVQNDQTVVLGGIISKDSQKVIRKVPILGDIPFLGKLFQDSTKSKGKTELVVFLTPHVVREPGDADPIRRYERQRLDVDPLKELDVPLVKPLDIRPEDLRRRRSQPDGPKVGKK
jgi:general secretion pathway protein D